MPLDIRKLRYFVAIGDAGALSHAAHALNVSQSALSHHVAELEADLGVRLIERYARGIRLTAAGRRLCEHGRAILAAIEKAEDDVKTFAEEAIGPVSIGMAHTAIDIAALPLMRAVRRDFPNVMLGLAEALSPTLTTRLLAGELDLAVVYTPPEDARLACAPVLEEDMFLVGQPDLVGSRQQPISFAEVLGYPILLPHPSVASRALIESFLLRNQLPSHIMEIDSLIAITRAIADGLGCSILARATVRAELSKGTIWARRIIDPTLSRTLYLAELRDRARTRAIEEVKRLVLDVILTEVAEGRWDARPLITGTL
jgi:LysR family transcriptional regulator, nitrogen assimilation regulatory protein